LLSAAALLTVAVFGAHWAAQAAGDKEREEAAAKLRDLADQLARNNQIEFIRGGTRYTVRVPDQVEMNFEIEIGESTELEVEIKW